MAQANSDQRPLRRVRSVVDVGGPITVTVVAVGLTLILLGAALGTGVWAGMFGIIGALLVSVAVVARIVILLRRRF